MSAHTRELDNYVTQLARCTQLLNEVVYNTVHNPAEFMMRAELALAEAKHAEQVLAACVQQTFDRFGVPANVKMELSGGKIKTKAASVVAGALKQAAAESRPRR